MNASPTILNIADPFPAAESVSQRSGGSRSDGSGESFDAVYDNESASIRRDGSNKDINNKGLKDNASGHKTEASADSDDQASVGQGEGMLEIDKAELHPAPNTKSAAPADDAARDEQTQNEALLSGIAVAQPVADNAISKGEELPLGGKILPALNASSTKEMQLSRTNGDAQTQELMDLADEGLDRAPTRIASQDAPIRNLQRSDSNDLLKQERLTQLAPSSSDYFQIEDAMELTPSRNSAESMLENLAFLGSNPSKESTSAQTLSSPVAAAAIAATNSDLSPTPAQASATAAMESLDSSLNVRGNTTDWSQAIGDKVRWMRNANISTAELHLNPAELGSIEIKIVTEDQQARVSFVTTSTVAQEMIEESISKLKELLADHGIALDQSDISKRGNQDQFAQKDQQAPMTEQGSENHFEHEAIISTNSPASSRIGQVDQYV